MSSSTNGNAEPLVIGTRLEPLVDDFLIADWRAGSSFACIRLSDRKW